MKVILLEDVKSLGKKGELVNVTVMPEIISSRESWDLRQHRRT